MSGQLAFRQIFSEAHAYEQICAWYRADVPVALLLMKAREGL